MASYSLTLTKDNLSLYTLPAAYILALAPRGYSAFMYKYAANKYMPTLQPRDFAPEVAANQSLDSRTKGRILRAEAAQANGHENLGFFCAAVAVGNFAGLNPWTLNSLSIGYLVSRVVFNMVYIYNDLMPSQIRTATFFVGIGAVFSLCIQAGNKLMRPSL